MLAALSLIGSTQHFLGSRFERCMGIRDVAAWAFGMLLDGWSGLHVKKQVCVLQRYEWVILQRYERVIAARWCH